MRPRASVNPHPPSRSVNFNARNLKILGLAYLLISIMATILMARELGLGGLIFIVLQGLMVCSVAFVLADMAENLLVLRRILEDINRKI